MRRAVRRRSSPHHIAACLLAPLLAATGLSATGAAPASAAYSTIEGSGSTWASTLVNQWAADVDASGIKVVYQATGSTNGRQAFATAATDFAVTDLPYSGEPGDTSDGRAFDYLPLLAGGTAFPYHVEIDGNLVDDLRLSGPTLVGIFTGAITNWADPAITADNNGRALPSLPITPVVRADGAGATYQVTGWMGHVDPAAWTAYAGEKGPTPYFPVAEGSGIVAQSGSDQVMNRVAGFGGNGAIAYVENSYPASRDYPVVKVANAAGYFVAPTRYDVAIALRGAEVAPDGTPDLTGVWDSSDKRAYPLSSWSDAIMPTGADDPRMTTGKRQALVDLATYSLCAGQTKAGPYGNAPLPLGLVERGFEALADVAAVDPDVELTDHDVSHCANPTFDRTDLDRDLLGEIAPQPQACDQVGHGPCGVAGGGTSPTPPPYVVIGLTRPGSNQLVRRVEPGRRYTVRVTTNAEAAPRYFAPIGRGEHFAGRGQPFRKVSVQGDKRRWARTTRVTFGRGVWRLGVRIGSTMTVLRLQRRHTSEPGAAGVAAP